MLWIIFFCLLVALSLWMIWMPGKSFTGEIPKPTESIQELADSLKAHVTALAEIGGRRAQYPDTLRIAERLIEAAFSDLGFEVQKETFEVGPSKTSVSNFYVEIKGQNFPDEILIVGAHYDSAYIDCPGANDNASGVAAVIELAKGLKEFKLDRTVRFVAFVNEEMPYFRTPEMGSYVHAHNAKKRGDNIVGMLSLETIGYFSDRANSQAYPRPFSALYPSTGNFIGFVSNLSSGLFLRKAVSSFRKHTQFPSEALAGPAWIPGIDWSDQWAFWKHGYNALMITDTAPYRYPHYHLPSDTPDKLDFLKMARIVDGIAQVISDLAGRTN